jgi:hypothetical protein
MTYPMIRTIRVFTRRYIPFWGRVRVVRISPLVAPIRIACLTCTVLLYEGVSHASWVNLFAKKFEWTIINLKLIYLLHSIVGMVSKLQNKSSLNSIHCDVDYCCSIWIMYTKTHSAWSTVNISIVIIIKLNICRVVLSISTKTRSTWPTVNFWIEVIIIFNINCITS